MPKISTAGAKELVDGAQSLIKEKPVEACIALAAAVVVGLLFQLRAAKKRKQRKFKRDCNDWDGSTLTTTSTLLNNPDSVLQRDQVKDAIDGYEELFSGARKTTGAITDADSVAKRQNEYQKMVNSFYNLVTDFYEYGWCQSFHFGPRWKDEGFIESIKRAEYHVASRLGLKPGMTALDVGCGVGGPMRNICHFSGAAVEGITLNQYQVNIGNKYNAQTGLADLCRIVQGDFQKLPQADNSFDSAYALEATCHSPDKVGVFSEVHRVLKPGGMFAGYEWVVLDGYDAADKDHVRIKEGIEVGNGLPTLATGPEVVAALEKAGFEVLDYYDANRGVHSPHEIPWYATLCGSFSLSGFRMTWLGREVTRWLVLVLETMRIAPRGSGQVAALLNATAIDLVDGGQREIFTPSFFFLARKK